MGGGHGRWADANPHANKHTDGDSRRSYEHPDADSDANEYPNQYSYKYTDEYPYGDTNKHDRADKYADARSANHGLHDWIRYSYVTEHIERLYCNRIRRRSWRRSGRRGRA